MIIRLARLVVNYRSTSVFSPITSKNAIAFGSGLTMPGRDLEPNDVTES